MMIKQLGDILSEILMESKPVELRIKVQDEWFKFQCDKCVSLIEDGIIMIKYDTISSYFYIGDITMIEVVQKQTTLNDILT